MYNDEYQYDQQLGFIKKIKEKNDLIFKKTGSRPTMHIDVYGCQQNQADGERLRGLLVAMGYEANISGEEIVADVTLLNTCAVRDHAEKRVLGHVGEKKRDKYADKILAICGCMAQQKTMQEKIRRSYPQVNLMFGTGQIHLLPQYIYTIITKGGRHFYHANPTAIIEDKLPVLRNPPPRAWVTIMTGCNNFCSYCIVPYVRGRERSRSSAAILQEIKQVLLEGYTEIFLLGQNVNSYAPENDEILDFPSLLQAINSLNGDFTIKFMTSHPKDADEKLLDTMAACEKVEKVLHLPFQSGSNDILKAMNRKYTVEDYKKLVDYARKIMPEINITSDVIVGFPNESEQDFNNTLELVKYVKFNSLYTFIYSKRDGTPAAGWEDNTPESVKKERFSQLLALQKEMEQK